MSNETNVREKVDLNPQYLIKLTVTLCVTCLIVAALLGLVNMVTADPIAEINRAKTEAAMKAVVADETSTFSDPLTLTDGMLAAADTYGTTLSGAYEVLVDGQAVGYALKVVAAGSQGEIEMMVGVDLDGGVTGVSIVNNKETSGIGSKVMDNEPLPSGALVLDQFIGMNQQDGDFAVGSNVDAISGATVSTRGVTKGVNGAVAAAAAIG